MGFNSTLLKDDGHHEAGLLQSEGSRTVRLGVERISPEGLVRESKAQHLRRTRVIPTAGSAKSAAGSRRTLRWTRKHAKEGEAAGAAGLSAKGAGKRALRAAGALGGVYAADDGDSDADMDLDGSELAAVRDERRRKAGNALYQKKRSLLRPGGKASADAAGAAEPAKATGKGKYEAKRKAQRTARAKAQAATQVKGKAAREMRRRAQQQAWRANVKRRLAARKALEGASATASGSAAAASGIPSPATLKVMAHTAPWSFATAPMAPIAGFAVALLLIVGVIAGSVSMAFEKPTNGGEALAQWAIAEYDSGVSAGDGHAGGQKYWSHCGFGGRVEWCSCFVKTGWDACGFDKTLGSPSGVGMANSWISWVKNDPSKGQLIQNSATYHAKPGDIAVSGQPNGVSNHVGIVVSESEGNGRFRCIEGNSGDRVASTYYMPGSYWDWFFRPDYPDATGTTFGEGVDFSMSETAFVRAWAPRIDGWFNSWDPGAPLAGYGEEFARAAYRHKYDPRLSPAMSRMESSGGRYCFRPYNAWGWGSSSWSSWPEAIDAHVAGLSVGYSGMTITEIVNKYCPDGNEATYIANLERWISEM